MCPPHKWLVVTNNQANPPTYDHTCTVCGAEKSIPARTDWDRPKRFVRDGRAVLNGTF